LLDFHIFRVQKVKLKILDLIINLSLRLSINPINRPFDFILQRPFLVGQQAEFQ